MFSAGSQALDRHIWMVEISPSFNAIPWQKHKDKLLPRSIQFSFEIFVDKYGERYIS